MIGRKRIISTFLLLPFKSKGKWYWMKRVLMVQVLLPMSIIGTDWCDVRVATFEDLIDKNII